MAVTLLDLRGEQTFFKRRLFMDSHFKKNQKLTDEHSSLLQESSSLCIYAQDFRKGNEKGDIFKWHQVSSGTFFFNHIFFILCCCFFL